MDSLIQPAFDFGTRGRWHIEANALKYGTILVMSCFPNGTSKVVTHLTKELYKRHAYGTVDEIKSLTQSSIIVQATIINGPQVLTKIAQLAKYCIEKENRCIFQLASRTIIYCSAGKVQIHLLEIGDVPFNYESRWQDGKTSITMFGLFLIGSQVNVENIRTGKILCSVGPPTKGTQSMYEEFHLPIEKFDILGKYSFIYASKAIVIDGVSIVVRSQAKLILPPQKKIIPVEPISTRWLQISKFAKKMVQPLSFKIKDCHSKCASNCQELRFDLKQRELIIQQLDSKQLKLSVKHWKGLLEIDLLNMRKEVLIYLQEKRASKIIQCVGPPSPLSHLNFVKDKHYLERWQEGLQVLNEAIHQNSSNLHFYTYIKIRGGIQFLLGDFETALQDYNLAHLNMKKHQSTVQVDRALVKCILGKYLEAMQDVHAVIALNPNINDIQELQTCIQHILDQQRSFQIVMESNSSCQQPLLSNQENPRVEILDLLTGDKWPLSKFDILIGDK